MPLPVLDATTLLPTGETLPLKDYFHPVRNPNWNGEYGSRSMFKQGKISIPTYTKLAKTFAKPEYIEDLIDSTNSQYSGAVAISNESYRNAFRRVFEALPEDAKWLALSMKIHAINYGSVGGTYTFGALFYHPGDVSYSEIIRNTTEVRFTMSVNISGFYDCVGEHQTTLATNLATVAPSILSNWERIPSDALIYRDDFCLNYFITRLSGYVANMPILTPIGNSDAFPVPFDYATPSAIAAYIAEGYNITISLKPSLNQILWKATLPPGDRRNLARVLNYSTNVLDLLPYTIKGPKEAAAPTYGVELESCSDYTPKQMLDAQKDLFFIMKQDGSISGSKSQRYEIVTVPASLKAHKRLWAELFEKIDYSKFDTTKDTGNGMHVHIGRKFFSRTHLNRFCWFITNPANFDFVFAISERPNRNDIASWAKMADYKDFTSKVRAYNHAESRCREIRGAVHFKGDKTVEVRLFKGIVSYATIVKNLEFVDSVFHFTQTTSATQLTLSNYLAWLSKTKANQYSTLKAFIAEIPLKEITAAAEVYDYIWNETADYKIADKLNKAPFKVTNTHITILNKKRRARTFILKQGQVHCVRNNGGLLAKLDKSLSQKQTRGAATFTMTNYAA